MDPPKFDRLWSDQKKAKKECGRRERWRFRRARVAITFAGEAANFYGTFCNAEIAARGRRGTCSVGDHPKMTSAWGVE